MWYVLGCKKYANSRCVQNITQKVDSNKNMQNLLLKLDAEMMVRLQFFNEYQLDTQILFICFTFIMLKLLYYEF